MILIPRQRHLREIIAETCENCVHWNPDSRMVDQYHPKLRPCEIKVGFPPITQFTDRYNHCDKFERK